MARKSIGVHDVRKIIRKSGRVVVPFSQTFTRRDSTSSPPKPLCCIPGVYGSRGSSVHSARKRAHTARNAPTEPFSCTNVIVHPPPWLLPPPAPPPPLPRPMPPPPTVKSTRKRTAFCTMWPVTGSYASSMRARSAPSGWGSGRSTGARRRRTSARAGATGSRERRESVCVRQWKRVENHPLTSPTAGETSSDDLGELSIGEAVRSESGQSSPGGGGASIVSYQVISFSFLFWVNKMKVV